MEGCNLCPRSCGTRRGESGGLGFCGVGRLPRVARAALHRWEEPCLSGSCGSGTIFFSGCNLKCVFCQNAPISHGAFGKDISVERLADIMDELAAQGAHNINLVTPSHVAPAILRALKLRKNRLPVVWNSNGYERVETLRQMEGAIDIYLPDFKFIRHGTAALLCGAGDYPDVAGRAIREMLRQVGNIQLNEDGLARKGVLIRHLVLPGRAEESIELLRWMADHLPDGIWLSLMGQYVPCGPARDIPGLDRALTQPEYDLVLEEAQRLGFAFGYTQELGAASESFIPPFDLTGVKEDAHGPL
nr:radical SAM protein [bacterium]